MASIAHQVYRCLELLTLNKEEIEQLKSELNTVSLKKALRPEGNPTKPLPKILSKGTYTSYFREGRTFFKHAKELTGEKEIGRLLTYDVITTTYDTFYSNAALGTASKIQGAIKKIYAGALELGWVKGKCPIENDLRDRNNDHVRKHRYGYHPADARKIIEYLNVHSRSYSVPGGIALSCGLRENEIAGLKTSNVNIEERILHFKGKGGRYREVPIPSILLEKLNSIKTPNYYFTPSESWCANFRTTVQKACIALGINGSGVHRLRATYAQLQYTKSRLTGLDDRQARFEVSKLLGHNRLEVTFAYIPRDFEWEEYVPYVELIDEL